MSWSRYGGAHISTWQQAGGSRRTGTHGKSGPSGRRKLIKRHKDWWAAGSEHLSLADAARNYRRRVCLPPQFNPPITPAPPFTSTCVFTRYKTNTVSSCANTTVNPAEELPFTKITAPAMKNTLQRFTFLWENRADGKRARCKRLMTVILLLTHIWPPHNCISLYTLLFSYCGWRNAVKLSRFTHETSKTTVKLQ